ncbi:MAG: JAB-like toxin 1 domain-containing protein, partial [Bacteroidota bacterium]|nr:JAB-like toxin 1 domain-containing protein [Bacteroidota bacterium]
EYELTNHLGNVLTVISDRKIGIDDDNDGKYDYYVADVISSQDYLPFGMIMPGRNYNANQYRFGFNGMQKCDEITNITGSHYTAEFWEYDATAAIRWNPDPVRRPWQSPYAVFSGNPILNSDPLGNLDDDYSVNKNGDIKLEKKTNDNFDVLYNKEEFDKGDIKNSIVVDKGVLNNIQTGSTKDKFGEPVSYDFMKVPKNDQAGYLFEFLHENTDVEWGKSSSKGENGEIQNTIGTSHGTGSNASCVEAYKMKNLISYDHNHPSGSKTPSGSWIPIDVDPNRSGDVGFARALEMGNQKPVFRILTNPGCEYTPFNGSTYIDPYAPKNGK